MNKTIYILLALICISFFCCNSQGNGEDNSLPNGSHIATDLSKSLVDSTFVKSIHDFLTWYKTNYNIISAIQLVRLIDDNGNERYSLDENNVTVYIEYLTKSGHFSEIYLANLKDYFIKADHQFSQNHQNDGPPVGFEFDLILKTQEPYAYFEDIENIPLDIRETQTKDAIVIVNNELVVTINASDKKISEIKIK